MALSLSAFAGLYVLAVSSVLPLPAGKPAQPVAARSGTVVIITPASYPPRGSVSMPDIPLDVGRAPQPAALTSLPEEPASEDTGTCRVGTIVMIPDGREGQVTSHEGDTCRVMAYGEAYVSLWNEDMIEPVYPQPLPRREFGH